MHKIKTLFAATAAICALSAGSAYANEFNLDVNLGGGAPVYAAPVVVAPSPAYVVAPWGENYDPHHRRHDWRYWHDHHPHDHDPHWDHR
jgi:hypothetical protein